MTSTMESRSVERVDGEGPPTSGEPYPAERPPISRSTRPCTLPDVSVIYRSIAIAAPTERNRVQL